jgi:hypothetical protein
VGADVKKRHPFRHAEHKSQLVERRSVRHVGDMIGKVGPADLSAVQERV